jgi:hypothetical protein
MTNQSNIIATINSSLGLSNASITYEQALFALFSSAGVTNTEFNGAYIEYLQLALGSSKTNITDLLAEYSQLFFDGNVNSINDISKTVFISSWKTDNAGTSTSTQITIPTVSSGNYASTIDWGDGNVEYITAWDDARWTHTYLSAGTYVVKISGAFAGWSFNNTGDDEKLVGITQVGIFNYNNEDGAFYGCSNLTSIDAADKPLIKDGSTSAIGFFRNAGITSADWNLYNFSLIEDFTNFLNGVTLDSDNYSQLLLLLLEQTLQTSVAFHGGSSKWSFGFSGQARFDLLSVKNWTSITDGGQKDATMGAWYNAHNVLKNTANPADGTGITTWSDLSDNANNATESSNPPLFKTNIANGEPMLLFNGFNSRLDVAEDASLNDLFAAGGSFTCAILPASDGEGSLGRVFSQSGGNCYLDLKDESGGACKLRLVMTFDSNEGAWSTSNLDIDINAVNIIHIEYDNSDVANDPIFYINSTSPTTLNEDSTPVGTATSPSSIAIGNAAVSNKTFDGYIGDVGFFKSVPTSTVRNERINYLATKFGVTL